MVWLPDFSQPFHLGDHRQKAEEIADHRGPLIRQITGAVFLFRAT